MKKFILLTIVSMISIYQTTAQDTIKIDLKNSYVHWKGEKVTGAHYGTIQLNDAYFIIEKDQIVGGRFIIDMSTIVCTDIENPVYALKLENHLKDTDFFNVSEHKNSSFDISSVLYDGISYIINGKANIKGIVKEISFPAQFKNKDSIFIANAKMRIDRTLFDIKYGSDSFFDALGNDLIYDEFTIQVMLKSF